jgi:tetratricopeptide (TPR) repeat protein
MRNLVLCPLLCLLLLPACGGRQAPANTWRDGAQPVEHAGSPLLLERLGDKYLADGQYEAAARRYEALLAERPGHAAAGLGLGLSRWLSGRPDLAAALWEDFTPALEELRPAFHRLAAGLTLLEYRLQAGRAAGPGQADLRLGRVALLPPAGPLAQGPRGKALHHLALAGLRRDFQVNAVPRERIRAFQDEAGTGPDPDRAAALEAARRLGAEYAVQWWVAPDPAGGVRLDLLILGVESPDGRTVRLCEELAAARGRLASLESGLAAARKELDALDAAVAHQELGEQLDRLLAERGPRAEEISALLRAGRTGEAKAALESLKALEQEIGQVSERQLQYRRTAFELFLGLYRPTLDILLRRRDELARNTDELAARAVAQRERVDALLAAVDAPLPAGGRRLSGQVPAGDLLPVRIPDQAARLLAAFLGRPARPGLPEDLATPGDPLGLTALEALGRALEAMDNAEYGEAEEAFVAARTLEPAPPPLPWPGFDPLALSRQPPREVAAAFAAQFARDVGRLRSDYAARGWTAGEFAQRLEGR